MAREASARRVARAARGAGQRGVAEARALVVVDHPHRLEEGMADGGAHEAEAASLELAAQAVGERRARRAPAATLDRGVARLRPEEGGEAAVLGLELQEGLGVADGGGDLRVVADDAGIREQSRAVARGEARDAARIEAGEGAAVAVAPLEDGLPAQARLRPLAQQEFEERAVVAH